MTTVAQDQLFDPKVYACLPPKVLLEHEFLKEFLEPDLRSGEIFEAYTSGPYSVFFFMDGQIMVRHENKEEPILETYDCDQVYEALGLE